MDAPAAGSGKSLLVDVASTVASGHRAAVIAQGANEAELEKRLGAALIAGDALISIDNCERPLGGELLCQALTQEMVKIRMLGFSKNVEVPANAAIFATGNNLTLVGDLCRRSIRCSLDSGVERPELREFDRDPIREIQRDRPKYVAACLTILRAYEVAGRPRQSPPLGGFEEWSGRIRDCLIWLGEADPCKTMEEIRAADPNREELTGVIEQWSLLIGDAPLTVREVIAVAMEQTIEDREFKNPDFREALLSVAGISGSISSKRLGKWLGRNKYRIVGGYRFVPDTVVQGFQKWRLERAEVAEKEKFAA